jgi:Ser/Thr protein kinase RdoA (MazF antagonist)
MSDAQRSGDEPATADDVSAIVAAVLGSPPEDVRPLGRGVTSEGWRADTSDGPLAVLVELSEEHRPPHSRSAPANYEAQHGLLERLHPLDARVPEPIATNCSEGVLDPFDGTRAWAVSTMVAGEPFGRDSTAAARDLGGLLARLHSLPHAEFGRLENRRDELRGEQPSLVDGVLWRWPGLWPYARGTTPRLYAAAVERPELAEDIKRLEEPLLALAQAGPTAVLHGDLWADSIRVSGGRLSGLVDFGDAYVGPPALDIANFALLSGWPAVDVLLDGYERDAARRAALLADARLFSIGLSLSVRGPAWFRKQALALIEETLPLAVRRDA